MLKRYGAKGSLFLLALLLVRADLADKVWPFAVPFVALVYFYARSYTAVTLAGVLAGSLTLTLQPAVETALGIVFFYSIAIVMRRFGSFVQQLSGVFVGQTVALSIGTFLFSDFSVLDRWLVLAIQVTIALVFFFMVKQLITMLPVRRRRPFKAEEMVTIGLLLAITLSGLGTWHVMDFSLASIASRYTVTVLAFLAGAMLASTTGVVIGFISSVIQLHSFYQLSVLAFAGLFGGLLREGRKIAVSVGLFVSTLLVGFYGEATYQLWATVGESSIAAALFLVTPMKWLHYIASFVPGTDKTRMEQQMYVRQLREATAQRVERFSQLFATLSDSFAHRDQLSKDEQHVQEGDYVLAEVTKRTCQSCFRREQCWGEQQEETYALLHDVLAAVEAGSYLTTHRLRRQWEAYCLKADKTTELMEERLQQWQQQRLLKFQVQESRKLVADQLQGVAKVMDDFARDIQRERIEYEQLEDRMLQAVEQFGVKVEDVEIYRLERGNIDIEMIVPFRSDYGEGQKLIAPLLSDLLNETVVVRHEEPLGKKTLICFRSMKPYVVEAGVAHAAKDGGFLSGDSYSMMEVSAGQYAIAISDGMGNGERAHLESNETLTLLKRILQSGIEERIAIQSVNAVLALRTTDEMFATLDLVIVDLQDGMAKWIKIGCAPSFIKRGQQVLKVEASNLPIGMFVDCDIDIVEQQLKPGDLLIIMSDGIFEGPKHVENYERWMRRKIAEIDVSDPQQFADCLMDEVMLTRSGEIVDDMTVIVAAFKQNMPKWSTIEAFSLRRRA